MRAMQEIEEIWRKDANASGAVVLAADVFKEFYVTENPDAPFVVFSKRTSWGDDAYQRHDFCKSWNEILKDPELREYITAVFVEGGMDEAHAKTHPFDEIDLFWSDYPREIFIY